jgi:hypothetical protein
MLTIVHEPESSSLFFRPYHFVVLGAVWGSDALLQATDALNHQYSITPNKRCLSLCGGHFDPPSYCLVAEVIFDKIVNLTRI